MRAWPLALIGSVLSGSHAVPIHKQGTVTEQVEIKWAYTVPHPDAAKYAKSGTNCQPSGVCKDLDADGSNPWCYTDKANGIWGFCHPHSTCFGKDGKIASIQYRTSMNPKFPKYADVGSPCQRPPKDRFEGGYLKVCYDLNSDGSKPWCYTDQYNGLWGYCSEDAEPEQDWAEDSWCGSVNG